LFPFPTAYGTVYYPSLNIYFDCCVVWLQTTFYENNICNNFIPSVSTCIFPNFLFKYLLLSSNQDWVRETAWAWEKSMWKMENECMNITFHHIISVGKPGYMGSFCLFYTKNGESVSWNDDGSWLVQCSSKLNWVKGMT